MGVGPRRTGAHASHQRPKSSMLHQPPNKTKETVSKRIYKGHRIYKWLQFGAFEFGEWQSPGGDGLSWLGKYRNGLGVGEQGTPRA